MTREEAINHFESYIGNECYTDYQKEACRMAISALCAKQTAVKLDRSRWEGCWSCNNQKIRELGLRHGREYCPCCGRPLTEKAWAELERRINDGTVD